MTDILTRLDEAAARAIGRQAIIDQFSSSGRDYGNLDISTEYERSRHRYEPLATAARRAILAELDAEGFVVVPKVATREMRSAGEFAIRASIQKLSFSGEIRAAINAAIAAAPKLTETPDA